MIFKKFRFLGFLLTLWPCNIRNSTWIVKLYYKFYSIVCFRCSSCCLNGGFIHALSNAEEKSKENFEIIFIVDIWHQMSSIRNFTTTTDSTVHIAGCSCLHMLLDQAHVQLMTSVRVSDCPSLIWTIADGNNVKLNFCESQCFSTYSHYW